MSVTPPENRIWWNESVPKSELIWVIVAFVWGLIMFFMMILLHAYGEQNLSNEAYKITAEQFTAKTEAMTEKYTVREESGYPVVHPPPGEDIYMIARLWQWWPILDWKKVSFISITSIFFGLDAWFFFATDKYQLTNTS